MNKKQILVAYRMCFALLGLSSIVTEIAVLAERGKLVPANFFSYFTVESNMLAVIILILSALALAFGKQGKTMTILRGASTLNMIVVGVVFSMLLSGLGDLTAVAWDNIVLHYILPTVVAVDWVVDIPKVRVSVKHALLWLIFPAAYLVYSLTRGHFVGWYPYPFLNPDIGGYGSVVLASVSIALGAAVLAWILAWSTRRLRVPRKRA